jgi:hypothetical protein
VVSVMLGLQIGTKIRCLVKSYLSIMCALLSLNMSDGFWAEYAKKCWLVLVNNSTNINTSNNHFSTSLSKKKRKKKNPKTLWHLYFWVSLLIYLIKKRITQNTILSEYLQNPIEKNVERDKLDTSNKPLTFLDWDRNFNTKWRG